MNTFQQTTTTMVTQFNDNPETRFEADHIPAENPGSNIPPVSQMPHLPSGGFHNQQELLISEQMRHDPMLQEKQAIPSPVITQERLHQGEILRSQSKKLSEIPAEDQQLHMPDVPLQPPSGPDPSHEHTKPGLGAKIKGGIDMARAKINEKIHPVHPTREAGVQQHYGIQPGQGLTQPLYRYAQYGPGVSDLPPEPINKIDNWSTQTQPGNSIKSDLKSDLGANLPPPVQNKLTMKEKIEIASVSKMPVDLSEMGLTNKPVVVKADLAGTKLLPPGGFVETKNTYTGMPEEFKQEYFAKAGALQKEHPTMAGKKNEDLTLGEKIKDTAAAGWEAAKEKASEAKEYIDDNLKNETAKQAWDTIKEKASDAKEWADDNITEENTSKAWETVKEKANDAKEYLDENLTGDTSKAWETLKEKTVEAKEWIDDKLETGEKEELETKGIKKDSSKKLTSGKKEKEEEEEESPTWEKIKDKAADIKTSLDRKMSRESRDLSTDELKELRAKYDEAKANFKRALEGQKSPAERFSEKKISGWESSKPAGELVADMLEKKLASEPEKTILEREYEAAERTRETKVDWGQISKKDIVKDSLWGNKRAYNDMHGFLKGDF